MSLTFENIEGKICAWIPPPPGDRLFWSFLAAPKLTLHATPQIGGRLLKYAYHASRASAWIQARVELSFKKNLVFPSGADVPLPLLLPLEDPRSADPLPTVKEAKERARHGRPPMPSRPQAAETGHVVDGAVQEEPRREMVSEAALRVDAGAREAQAPRPAVAVERLGHRRSVSAEAVSGSRQDSQSNEQSVHGRRPGEGGGAFLQMRLHNPS